MNYNGSNIVILHHEMNLVQSKNDHLIFGLCVLRSIPRSQAIRRRRASIIVGQVTWQSLFCPRSACSDLKVEKVKEKGVLACR